MGFLVFLVIVVVVVVVVVVKKINAVVKENKLKEAQKKAVEELKDSGYAGALEIKEMLEKMGKGCNFGEPTIRFNYKHKHQAYAVFSSHINIPSETECSDIEIHATKFEYEHDERMEDNVNYCLEESAGCILDMSTIIVFSYENSQELIDGVFKKLFISYSGCNMYVKGKLTSKPSDELPVFPKEN